MVSRRMRRRRGDKSSVKMAGLDRQSSWTRHLNHSKSIRLRLQQTAKLNARCKPSINHHNQRHSQPSTLHRRVPLTSGQHNVISRHTMASFSTTTSGREEKISAPVRKLTGNTNNSNKMNHNNSQSRATGSVEGELIFGRSRPRAALLPAITLSAILMLLGSEIHLINCDSYSRSASIDSKVAPPAPQVQNTGRHFGEFVERRSGHEQAKSSSFVSPAPHSSSPSSHPKEKILSSLMDSIERQHARLSPGIRSLSLARPSKFDSGNERLQEAEASSVSGAQISTRSYNQVGVTASKQPAKTLDDIMNQHYGRPAGKTSFSSSAVASRAPAGSKADQGLHQIMMLHEQAAAASAANSHASQAAAGKPETVVGASQQRPSLIGKHLARLKATTPLASSTSSATNHLWSSASHLLSNTNSTKKTSKILTNVVAYLSPSPTAATNNNNNNNKPATNSSNPFTARMNGKSVLLGPLLGLGQMFAPDVKQQTGGNKYSLPLFGSSNSAEMQANYVLSNAINQPQGFSGSLKGLADDKRQSSEQPSKELLQEASSTDKPSQSKSPGAGVSSWLKIGANQLAQSHSFQDSFRDLLTLSQLPILLNGPVSTAPSELEPGGKKHSTNRLSGQPAKNSNRTQTFDDIFRYAYILANLAVRRKRDPLKVLGPSSASNALVLASSASNKKPLWSLGSRPFGSPTSGQNPLIKLPPFTLNNLLANRKIKPRGVMWDMATDPSLAVTVFHLLERASVALPLGFLLMPFVHMIRNPLNGFNLGRIIPARASHRSVDYEELARRINSMDKMLSRALRPTHRESAALSFVKR